MTPSKENVLSALDPFDGIVVVVERPRGSSQVLRLDDSETRNGVTAIHPLQSRCSHQTLAFLAAPARSNTLKATERYNNIRLEQTVNIKIKPHFNLHIHTNP